MQGRKTFTPKVFYQTSLDTLVASNNYYRRLDKLLDLHFLYKRTEKLYGTEGQSSIDPIVFVKICLVGYLNNIISDRKLILYCGDSLSIRLFLGYDIDESLPCHSTISRTRHLFGEAIFQEVFQRVLSSCIDGGLVAGHTQAIDSAFVKANASMDSLELKVPEENLEDHLRKVRAISAGDKDQPFRIAKENKASKEQQTIQAKDSELRELKTRTTRWSKLQTERPGASNKGSRYTSNKTHYSPVDPDARISVKPGKARKLNYFSQLAVDTSKHVITQIQADFSDSKDNIFLQDLVSNTRRNLAKGGLSIENILADAGYSSGENYAWLEAQNMKSYIPPHGTYKGGPAGFEYIKEGNYWLCKNGKHVTFRKQKIEKGTLKDYYFTRRSDCKGCPFRTECIGKSHEKRIGVTAYRAEYERNNARLKKDKWHLGMRMGTVEPVFGTLINFLGMRKVNTRGKSAATKCMLMAATAYNLKKLLKYSTKKRKTLAAAQAKLVQKIISFIGPFRLPSEAQFAIQNLQQNFTRINSTKKSEA
jgi:transposase